MYKIINSKTVNQKGCTENFSNFEHFKVILYRIYFLRDNNFFNCVFSGYKFRDNALFNKILFIMYNYS
jgi:hypothetical protein